MNVLNYKTRLDNISIHMFGPLLVVPIYSNPYNVRSISDLVALVVYTLDQPGGDFVIPFTHNDTSNFPIEILSDLVQKNSPVWVYGKKDFMKLGLGWDVMDMDLLVYMKKNEKMDAGKLITNAHTHFNKFKKLKSKGSVIPIVKHVEYADNVKNEFMKYYNPLEILPSGFESYNSTVIGTLDFIENAGVEVDEVMIANRFPNIPIKDGKVYSNYNIYTLTGRPSNSHYNMNFAALNKSDGTRNAIISRYSGKFGKLIQLDFDSYHLRLISKLINYKFPDDVNIHDYLGKYYFGVEELTEEEYNKSKTVSFRQLYGGVQSKYKEIPFFTKTTVYINQLWEEWEVNGYVATPVFKRRFTKNMFDEDDMNPTKLFNYILQAYETERNLEIINKMIPLYKLAKSKIVLYTYDSILIDYSPEDSDELIFQTREFLEEGGFPVTVKSGINYGRLESGY